MSVNLLLIILTCLISIQAFNKPGFIAELSHYPMREARDKQYYRMFTAAFVHADLFHLFVNMFVLYGFGEYLESQFSLMYGGIFGPLGYLAFYMVIAGLANLPTYIKHKDNYHYRSIGASGATSGIVFAYILFEPTSMLGLYAIIPVPAIIFGILYLFYSSYASRKGMDNIDHDAHFYGALTGLLLMLMLKPMLIQSFIFKIVNVF
jgi:membrane associated rhomboid family serine protease